ncbi:MAG: hypothetical protein JWO33_1103 [Caulobacteraceae bacterium]|nr:hypothetical protein [Caulobacteraceae bacterium]
MKFLPLAAAFAVLSLAGAAQATVKVTYEAPRAQLTTVALGTPGVETFDGRSSGGFTTDFGAGGKITGVYSNLRTSGEGLNVFGADTYGGAGGTGSYAATFDTPGYQLDLTSTEPGGVNYFGLWVSAIDEFNKVTIYSGDTAFEWNSSLLPASIDSAYNGNPTNPWNQNSGQKYVFVNFFSSTPIDKITFGGYGAGFETDNHTVGFISAAPEPATWGLMIVGFGAIGAVLRRRRAQAPAAA